MIDQRTMSPRDADRGEKSILFYQPPSEFQVNQADLEKNLLDAFKANRDNIQSTKKSFEHWKLIMNPYSRLRTIIDRYEKRLIEIDLKNVNIPLTPQSNHDDILRFQRGLKECQAVYLEAMSLAISLHMLAPVMGEAAVNFVFKILALPDLRNDERLCEDFLRRNIDIRVKSLHLHCSGFTKPVDASQEAFKKFHNLMNRRNDHLHGNINLNKVSGDDLYFDYGNIPLVKKHQSLTQIALANVMGNVDPDAAIQDVLTVRNFVDFLLSHVEDGLQPAVRQILSRLQVGYDAERMIFGDILRTNIDIIPVNIMPNE